MATTKIGLIHGKTIELESPMPELEGQRVRVVVEAMEETGISAEQQRELWQGWIAKGPQGPIDEGADTEIP